MRLFYLGLAMLMSGQFSQTLNNSTQRVSEQPSYSQTSQPTTTAEPTVLAAAQMNVTPTPSSVIDVAVAYFNNWRRRGFVTATPRPTATPFPTATVKPSTPKPTVLATATPTPTKSPTPTPVVLNNPNKMMWGAMIPDWEPAAITTFETLVGKKMSIYGTFVHWGNEKDFPMLYTSSVRDQGKTMLIFWEATDYNNDSINQPQFNYDSILNGKWDSYFTQFAADAKTYGGPVILIPFSEMNDNTTPWGGQVNGNTPAKFIAAYQRIRGFFKNATNVKFGWSPNNVSSPQTAANDLDAYYPGDAYVDYVGVDGFNFGSPWQTWTQVFDKALTQLSKHNKPMLISSTASAAGSQKASWITDGFGTQIKKYPLVQGWVWFNENKEENWLINSDASALAAFKSVLP